MGLLDFLSSKDRGARERKAARARKGAELYAAAVAQARQPALYTDLAAPDTLDGRFELIVLHVHLLCRRLGGLGDEGAGLAQALFDTMFRDMDRNLRELGVGDPSVPRRIKAMIEAYYGRIKAYDAAFGAGGDALAGTIARNVYNAADVSDTAEAMAAYARRAQESIDAAPEAELLTGRVACPPVAAEPARSGGQG
jgi:cytochrome b pre-mRNA-processing protein 3